MTSPLRSSSLIWCIRLRAASAALALAVLLLVTASHSAQAQIFKVLHSFDGADGAGPVGTLVQATNGDLYGATGGGGAVGAGTVFKITPGGTLTTLYSFCSQTDCTDGDDPQARLVQDTNGDLYGTTFRGGANGLGTVFKITPSGTLTTLYSFCSQSNCADGNYPAAALVQATNGDFYGTTLYGGDNQLGTVFKITPSGTLTKLHDFNDGFYPQAALVQATNGDFYGTTPYGGPFSSAGTVFKITPTGMLTTLYDFCSQENKCPDGNNPNGLVQATDGNFYGTTVLGGAKGNDCGGTDSCGTVFKITPSGMLTTLYSFCSQCADGAEPRVGLVQATDGNLYGTTSSGGAKGGGTIFKITPTGTLTTLYSFCSQSNCN